MAATVQRIGGDFSSLGRGVILPVTEGLLGAYFPGTDAQRTRRNYAPEGADAIIAGTPEYHNGYARFTASSAFMDLDISEVADMTLMLAWRSVNADATPPYRFPIGNVGSSDTVTQAHGVSIRAQPGTGFVGVTTGAITNGTPGLVTVAMSEAVTSWRFDVATVTATGVGRQLINKTTGLASPVGTAIERLINATRKFRLGSSHVFGDTAQVDIAAAFIYGRVVPVADQDRMYALAQARCARASIPI